MSPRRPDTGRDSALAALHAADQALALAHLARCEDVAPAGVRVLVRAELDGAIRALGAEPRVRRTTTGDVFRSDEAHCILDCRFPDGIADPHHVAAALRARPGVVETGLFLDLQPEVIVGRVT